MRTDHNLLISSLASTTFAPVFAAIVVGALFSNALTLPLIVYIIVLTITFISIVTLVLFQKNTLFSIAALLFVATFTGYRLSRHNQALSIAADNTQRTYRIQMLSRPKTTEHSLRFNALIIDGADSIARKYQNKKIIVSIPRTSSIPIEIGGEYDIFAAMAPPSSSQIPYSFNYAKYLRNNNIYTAIYLNEQQIIFSSPYTKFNLSIQLERARNSLINHLINNFSYESAALYSAIVLGTKDLLPEQQKEAFTAAGVQHILVVSGMHVGFIFLVILFFYKRIPNKTGKVICQATGILILWFYALFTGFAPSVVRAALMFSILLLNVYSNKTNIIHSLFLAACITSLINPAQIFNIGFQLSYLAVFSISLCSKKWAPAIQRLRSPISRFTLSALSTTLYAQIITLPLILQNFGQFPLFFLLSNLIATLLAPIIFFSGILALIPLPSIITPLLDWPAKAFIYIIQAIANLPAALIHVSISTLSTALLYCVIATALLVFLNENSYRQKQHLSLLAIASILFLSSITFDAAKSTRSNSLIIPNTYRLAINVVHDNENIVFTNDTLYAQNIYQPLWRHFRASQARCITDSTVAQNIFIYNAQTYLILRDNIFRYKDNPHAALEIDNLIIDSHVYPSEKLFSCFVNPHKVILTNAVNKKYIPIYQKMCNERDIDLYSVAAQGAYIR